MRKAPAMSAKELLDAQPIKRSMLLQILKTPHNALESRRCHDFTVTVCRCGRT